MPAVADMLRPAEAAVVARVTVREVNRAIDEHILPDAFVSVDNGRQVTAGACSFISFYFATAHRLTSEERLLAIRTVGPTLAKLRKFAAVSVLLREDWTVRDEFLTIDLKPFVERTCAGLADLDKAREMVTISDDVLGGTPVIRGTRVPVYDVAASIAAGHSTERILAAYPSLDAEMLRLAAIYAEANPARGRPRAAAELPEGAVIISNRRVARARKAG